MTNEQAETIVYLGLGTNLGEREENLRGAIAKISALGLEITAASSVYETEPVGLRDQPWFLNQVLETTMHARSMLTIANEHDVPEIQATALLSELHKIEREMGRERTVADGPRVIDIDLLLFGGVVIGQGNVNSSHSQTELVVPHPRMHVRRFVLEPLCEIAPDVVHPVLKKTCLELLASLEDESRVRLSQPQRHEDTKYR